MRPVSLELENFRSHRHTSVRLADYPTVVLLGENGAGKSCLPEAMAWALYGRGRTRNPVSRGAMECRVAFVFDLNGERYMVERQRSLSGRGQSELRLCVVDTEGFDPPRSIGGATIAETQATIDGLLHMGYDLWLSTSYIGQGDADRFTQLEPRERKQLLADLLDVGVYQAWSQDARDRARGLAGEEAAIASRAGEIDSRLAGREGAEDALDEAAAYLEEAAADVREGEALLRDLQMQVAEAREQAATAKAIKDRLTDMRSRREQDADRARRELASTVEQLAAANVGVERLEAELHSAQATLEKATRLEGEAFNVRTDAEAAEGRAKRNQETAEREGEKAAAASVAREGARADLREVQEQIAALEAGDAKCPTCRRAFDSDEERLACLGEQRARAIELEKKEGWHGREQGKAAELARIARGKMDELLQEAAAHREQLSVLERGASAAAAAGDRIPALEQALADGRDQAGKLAEQVPALEAHSRELRKPTSQERDLEAQVEGLAEVLNRVVDLGRTVEETERAVAGARAALTERTTAVARARAAVEQLDTLAGELAELQERAAGLAARREAFEMACRVLGRDGIQALMVENAIPEIQDEANAVLERLTDGRFRVSLETLGATKKGEIRETLDVLVWADGEESLLEDLSGGERQCVDLALRIGLARLLARRAGTRIETLVLDEAFTALDVGHRQRTIELLHDLAQEFPWLLFITHLAELADAFPMQIKVERTAEGSVVQTREAVPA